MAQAKPRAVIDADGHVVEPSDLWARFLPQRLRARAPRFVTDERGRPSLLIDDRIAMRAAMLLTLGPNYDFARLAKARPGGADPKARLVDLDSEGIAAAVLFPSVSLFLAEVDDAPLQAALCAAYNDWLAEYCSTAPARLIGVAMVPLADVDGAVRELERAVDKYKFRGVFVRPNPCAGRPIHHPVYDRLWACAASLGVPICVHEGLADSLPTLGRERFDNAAIQHVLSHPFEQMAASAGLILCGVLERHPQLRIAFLESGSAWLPYWLARMDSHHEVWGEMFPVLQLKPSEYFQRQCAISTDPEESAVDAVVKHVGAGQILWSSDYPHPDSHFPGAVEKTLEGMAGVDPAARELVFSSNAARLFRIDLGAARRAATGG
jgi:predicted TIM-barrel fold metal-dependent hydrolase